VPGEGAIRSANIHTSAPSCALADSRQLSPTAASTRARSPRPTPLRTSWTFLAHAQQIVTYHRRELYEQVWSESMRLLAKRDGDSNVSIADVCRTLCVPRHRALRARGTSTLGLRVRLRARSGDQGAAVDPGRAGGVARTGRSRGGTRGTRGARKVERDQHAGQVLGNWASLPLQVTQDRWRKSDVELELRLGCHHCRIRDEYLTDRVREADCHWLRVPQRASVVVQLGKAKHVSGN